MKILVLSALSNMVSHLPIRSIYFCERSSLYKSGRQPCLTKNETVLLKKRVRLNQNVVCGLAHLTDEVGL